MFLVMAIGMACGTRFYMLAAFASAVFTVVISGLYKLDVFSKHVTERILRVRLPLGRDSEETLEPIFREYLTESRLVAMESVGGVQQELVYVVLLKDEGTPDAFVEAVRTPRTTTKLPW